MSQETKLYSKILAYLANQKTYISAESIADGLGGLKTASLIQILFLMSKKGWVNKKPNPDQKLKRIYRITAQGNEALKDGSPLGRFGAYNKRARRNSQSKIEELEQQAIMLNKILLRMPRPSNKLGVAA